jgi:L-aspartate oxidase
MYTFDFLVLGSGAAGLNFALKASKLGSVAIITKEEIYNTSTYYAQGGIVGVVYPPDNFEKHIQDTLEAGSYLNDKVAVEITSKESPDRIKDLIDLGVRFDKKEKGVYDLAREGGHSEPRIFHFKDKTGYEIERVLSNRALENPNIYIFDHHFAVELITQHHIGVNVDEEDIGDIECYGAYVLTPAGKVERFLSKFTVLATGGSGNVYLTTTNPTVATGDGVAMAYRAKAQIMDMEFFQFHPTALYNPKERPAFLITEALRGYGAVLKDINGKEFMHKYDPRKSLAPRDIVARAIDNEMKLSGSDHVFLDCRHINKDELLEHFPTIYAKCLSIGIDMTKEMIPVVPAAHYQVGGVLVDYNSKTQINRLYACGEVSRTGLHGANRLGSNSLLEALVFSHRAALDVEKYINDYSININIPEWNDEGVKLNEELVLITQEVKELNQTMTAYVGIVRSNLRLNRALKRLQMLHEETEELYKKSVVNRQICELRNMILVGYLITKMALARKESIGLHYNIDYPFKS